MSSNTLTLGRQLKNGEYSIIRVLGQGGFGITYEAEQVSLGRKVAIKEFFMKEHCDRDETTSAVTVPSSGSKELVEKFRQKFIREAKMIAGFDNEHIVKIYDVFEENGTAYYVMEYLPGGSLSDVVKSKGALSESAALGYIRQIADALSYLHEQNTLHLDVKPSNVLLNQKGQLKLIDFGISKHFDEGGHQTSSTPIGISKGFAPLEQYQQEDVASFSPATDIYALGATLFNMLTGSIPPEASAVMNNGLPAMPGISTHLAEAIEKAMSPRKKDRPQTIEDFLSLLNTKEEKSADEEETTIVDTPKPSPAPSLSPLPRLNVPKWLWAALSTAIAIILCVVLWPKTKTDFDMLEEEIDLRPSRPSSITLEEGKTFALLWEDIPIEAIGEATIWKSARPYVAKVDNAGMITAIQEGKAIISAKKGRFVREWEVTVIPKQEQTVPSRQITHKEKASKPVTGTLAGHEWVDLGLPSGLKWAATNVGASSPGDYGSYFAWGETSPKSSYSWGSYKWCNGTYYKSLAKYNTKSENGTIDYKEKLALSDDAARQNWGSSWRMPTKQEFEELKSNCTEEWTTMNGHSGRRFTSKKNGKSIFLPFAGWRDNSDLKIAGSYGYYWSSSLRTGVPENAGFFYVYSDGSSTSNYYRYRGQSVRPVTE